jgi:hypothetical protein
MIMTYRVKDTIFLGFEKTFALCSAHCRAPRNFVLNRFFCIVLEPI